MQVRINVRYYIETEIWSEVVLVPYQEEKSFKLHYPERYADAGKVKPGYVFDAVTKLFRQLDNNIVEKVFYPYGSEEICIKRTTTKEQFFKNFLYYMEPNREKISMKIKPCYSISAGKENKVFILKPSKEDKMYILTYQKYAPDYYILYEDVLEVINAIFKYVDKDIVEIIRVSDSDKRFYTVVWY